MTSVGIVDRKIPRASGLTRFSRRMLAALAIAAVSLSVDAQNDSARNDAEEPPMQLLVLGSGGPGATGRASSSYLVLISGEPRILVDAGPGAFARLGEAKVSLESLDTILLTHLHIDHAAELPGIIKAAPFRAAAPFTSRCLARRPPGAERSAGISFDEPVHEPALCC